MGYVHGGVQAGEALAMRKTPTTPDLLRGEGVARVESGTASGRLETTYQ